MVRLTPDPPTLKNWSRKGWVKGNRVFGQRFYFQGDRKTLQGGGTEGNLSRPPAPIKNPTPIKNWKPSAARMHQ
jgi:hypothetical protein